MNAPTYQVFGTGTPTLLGRAAEVASIRRQWRNNHASVIGPKFFGKTVLLRHLASVAKEDGFTDVVYWNMRQPVPETEQQFYALFQRHLREQSPSVREYLEAEVSDDTPEAIHDAFEFLQADSRSVLVVMQSMDEMLLRGDSINPNLWDQLATLAELESIRFLISSRRKLIELVPSQRAKLSDFWRRIGCVRPVGAFGSADLDPVLAPLTRRGVQIDGSARKELMNWSGGVPPLLIGLCEVLEQHPDGAALTKSHVDAAAKEIDRRCVDELWSDIPPDIRERCTEMAEKKSLSRNQCELALLDELRARGLATEEHGQLKPTSRLLDEHAQRLSSTLPEMRRLFGTTEVYLPNVRRVLDLRMVQAASWHPQIKRQFNAILQQLDNPDAATKMLRGIYDLCADAIIKLDFPEGRIPEEWVKDWDSRGKLRQEDRDPKRRGSESRDTDGLLQGKVPTHRRARMKLLSLLRDDKILGTSNARPSTLWLLNGLLDASNYCSHAYEVGESVPSSFACAALFSALELCAQLSEDLRK